MGRKPYKKRNNAPIKKEEDKKVDIIEEIEQIEDLAPVEEAPYEAAESCVEEEVKPEPLYEVHVNHPSLRKRSGPSYDEPIVGLIEDKGIYGIYAEVGNWGKLEDGAWIALEYTGKVKK